MEETRSGSGQDAETSRPGGEDAGNPESGAGNSGTDAGNAGSNPYAHSFDFLTVPFFTKAAVFPGSLGTFRYRFQRFSWIGQADALLRCWVYENVCFELAKDVETADFPWTEEGVAALRAWLAQKALERGAEPYHIPFPPARNTLRG